MPSRLSRFTDRLVTLAKRAVSGDASLAVKKGDGGHADWVVVVIHGLREYLDLPYRRLLEARSSRSTSTPKQVNNDATERLDHGAGE